MRKMELLPGDWVWRLSSDDEYFARARSEVETERNRYDNILPKMVLLPMAAGYQPELDASPELRTERVIYFRSLIGVLRWAMEHGHIDIIVEVGLIIALSRSAENWSLGLSELYLHLLGEG